MSEDEIESLPTDLAALLDVERSQPDMPPAMAERVLRRVEGTTGLATGASSGGSTAVGAARTTGAFAGRALFGATMFVCGGLVGSILHAQLAPVDWAPAASTNGPSTPPRLDVLAPPADLEVASAPATSVAPEPVVAPTASAPASSATATAKIATRPAAPPPSAPANDTDLTAERSIIDLARTALAHGEPAAALDAVKRHASRFPDGQLAEERERVWVQALVAAGEHDEARARAARFRKRFPAEHFLARRRKRDPLDSMTPLGRSTAVLRARAVLYVAGGIVFVACQGGLDLGVNLEHRDADATTTNVDADASDDARAQELDASSPKDVRSDTTSKPDAAPPDAGGNWSLVPSGDTNDLRGVWGDATEAWAVGAAGTVLHFAAGAWSRRKDPTLSDASLAFVGVWGSGPSDVWAAGNYSGQGKLAHWTGSQWDNLAPTYGQDLSGIWGSGASDVWVVASVGPNDAFHWTGSADWIPFADPTSLFGVTGNGSRVFAVTIQSAGHVLERGASGWQDIAPNPLVPGLPSGGMSAAGDLWVTAVGGAVYSYVGGTWNSKPTGTTNTFRAICETSDAVWAVGDGGIIGRYAGGAWTLTTGVTSSNLRGIYAASATDIWAVGDAGTVLHYGP